MSLFNPPNSPSAGVTYSFGSNIWEWNGYAWIKYSEVPIEQVYEWNPPADWLTLPEINSGDQKIAGLYAIYPGGSGASGGTASGNFFSFALSGCTYVVDWGDGTTQSYSSGATAQKNYDFASISSSTQTSDGFRQVIMQAYPSIVGTTFSGFDFSRKYTVPGVTSSILMVESLLMIKMASNTLTGMTFSVYNNKIFRSLKSFEYVGPSNIKNFTNTLVRNAGLEKVIGTEWTSQGITFDFMFAICDSLPSVPLLDMANAKSAWGMFQSCYRLESVPQLNTSGILDFRNFFYDCRSLKTLPNLNYSSGTNFSTMCQFCSNLKTIPHLTLTSATTVNNMFASCVSLREVGGFTFSSSVNLESLFNSCASLEEIPFFDSSMATSTFQMFIFCSRLISVPNLNLSKVTNASNMFIDCRSLPKLPLFDLSQCTNTSNMLSGCYSLKSAALKDLNASTVYSDCNLSSAALNDVFTYLGVTGAGKTITIGGNWGASGCDRSIATAKGWAVSG